MTPKTVLRALDERDGRVCVWHGETCDPATLVPQHRAGGMGGGKSKHRLSNVLWLDALTNGLIEADADMAAEARRRGIKISLHADPRHIPVEYPDGLFWLTDDGRRLPADTPTPF
jgi:hypothetical protein